MKRSDNPFNPQFGVKPESFVGRDQIISDFLNGLDFLNIPNRTTVLTGLRGSGKTALLSQVTKGHASKYRQRLLDSGLIQREARGELSFTLPFMREYVLDYDD